VAHDVFISYSQPDQACADELVARVEREGIKCWIAPRDIAPSSDWAAEIIDAISKSSTMVLVFSANSNDSPQVRREVERAVHKNVCILPFRIEHVLPSKSLEYFLSAQHWLDAFPPPMEPHYARLCAYLKTQLGLQTLAPVSAQLFDPADMRRIERQLAGYLGPVAKHLVKHAALRAAGMDDLLGRLAMELDTELERREFTRRCRTGKSPAA
jgi:TIR domain